MGSFTAAGTAYATHGQAVIPFYIYYSMFGYQRVGDLIWAFGDSRGRGFMLGGTADARRSTARACSTRTDIRRCCSARFRTCASTIRRSRTSWRR